MFDAAIKRWRKAAKKRDCSANSLNFRGFFFITDIALPVLRPRAHHCSSCCRCVLRPAPKILLIAQINSTSQFVWRNPFQTNPAIQIESFKRAPLSKQRTKLFIATLCNRCLISMDHHCPWTNTCVGLPPRSYVFLDATCVWLWGGGKLWGQINLKAFVQFVHFVPVATFHAVWSSGWKSDSIHRGLKFKACDISWRF